MEKKNFPEKGNQPLSNRALAPLLTPRLGMVDCGTQKGNGMTRNPKMEIFEPVGNRLLVGLLARAR